MLYEHTLIKLHLQSSAYVIKCNNMPVKGQFSHYFPSTPREAGEQIRSIFYLRIHTLSLLIIHDCRLPPAPQPPAVII